MQLDRRRFTTMAAAGVAVAASSGSPATLSAQVASDQENASRIFKAVKISMIRNDVPLMQKFELAQQAGFDGITLFAPDKRYRVNEALAAAQKSGLIIHNINNAVHWKQRLSDPDETVRRQSVSALSDAIRFADDVGASSVLLVVGKVTHPEHENHEQVWKRSIAGIEQVLPLASRLGVRILCENVANGFCESAQQWAAYLDEINSPWVGAFFDIGNHQSYGGADSWIPVLGSRIVKLDIKGHRSDLRKNCDTFEGDVDWAAVRNELHKLNFTGWATAEVPGGDLQRLTQVAQDMDRALGLS